MIVSKGSLPYLTGIHKNNQSMLDHSGPIHYIEGVEFDKSRHWTQFSIVAFDTETSGAYPVESEIIELGAVKWQAGKIVDRFQSMLRPSKPLIEENIRIHGITNEMVAEAPLMLSQIGPFCEFIDGSLLLAHHAPFDLGFLVPEIEKQALQFPKNELLCTSLIARGLLATTNHKLQTLVKELQLEGGAAHRAYDDAYACFQVFEVCCQKLGPEATLGRLLAIQNKALTWDGFRLWTATDRKVNDFARFAQRQLWVDIVYAGGSVRASTRPIRVFGIVRGPDGDFVHAECGVEGGRKRFYLEKIRDYAAKQD
jgi:DNA polymerase III subunit epsilon